MKSRSWSFNLAQATACQHDRHVENLVRFSATRQGFRLHASIPVRYDFLKLCIHKRNQSVGWRHGMILHNRRPFPGIDNAPRGASLHLALPAGDERSV